MSAFWVGVASREHVEAAVVGGFCQLNHGKAAPLERMAAGDRIVYYSPRERMRDGEPVQAFTAIGEVLSGEVRQAEEVDGFAPYRLGVRYFQGHDAPIGPLLSLLSFTKGKASWGVAFRRGSFQIEPEDHRVIAEAMGITDPACH